MKAEIAFAVVLILSLTIGIFCNNAVGVQGTFYDVLVKARVITADFTPESLSFTQQWTPSAVFYIAIPLIAICVYAATRWGKE